MDFRSRVVIVIYLQKKKQARSGRPAVFETCL